MTLVNYMIVLYLLAILVVGVLSSRGILNYRDYIMGKKRYPLWIIYGTTIGTLVGGARTIGDITKIYEIGLIYIIANSFNILSHIITAKFIVPKICEFNQVHSISEIMGIIYGKGVRCITALFGTILCFAIVGMQILAMSLLFEGILGTNFLAAVICSMLLMVFYATIGGLHSIIITDIFQLIIIIVMIPSVIIISVDLAGGIKNIILNVPHEHCILLSKKDSINYVFLAAQYVFPIINPAIIQRLLITEKKDAKKIIYALAYTEAILLVFSIIVGFTLLTLLPQMKPNEALITLINVHFPEWLQILVIIGFLSVTMSTADSFLNKAGILFIHDFVAQFVELTDKTKLLITKIFTLFAGIAALIITLKFKNIIDMRIYFLAFFIITIMVPFLFGIFAKKVDKKIYIISTILGLLFIIFNSIYIGHNFSYIGNVACIFISAIPFIFYLSLNCLSRKR